MVILPNFLKFIFIGIWLLYSVVLVSATLGVWLLLLLFCVLL